MATYQVYDAILDGHEAFNMGDNCDQAAIDYARGMVWAECESKEQSIAYARCIGEVDGVGVFYDFGADYYFFTED